MKDWCWTPTEIVDNAIVRYYLPWPNGPFEEHAVLHLQGVVCVRHPQHGYEGLPEQVPLELDEEQLPWIEDLVPVDSDLDRRLLHKYCGYRFPYFDIHVEPNVEFEWFRCQVTLTYYI